MEKVLGRKQSIRNEDWINAMQHIEDLVKKEELDTLVDQTVSEILEQTEGKGINIYTHGEMLPADILSRLQRLMVVNYGESVLVIRNGVHGMTHTPLQILLIWV